MQFVALFQILWDLNIITHIERNCDARNRCWSRLKHKLIHRSIALTMFSIQYMCNIKNPLTVPDQPYQGKPKKLIVTISAQQLFEYDWLHNVLTNLKY